MPGIKPGETLSQYAIRVAYETGNFWNPDNPEGFNVAYNDLKNLKPTDDVVVRAMISMSKMDASRYTKHVLEKHGRPPVFDGVVGPAIEAMVTDGVSRCPVPDYAPPQGVSFQFEDPYVQEVALRMQKNVAMATGSGSWAGCHGVGDFHSAAIGVNLAGIGSFLKPLFLQVLKNVQKSYAGIGLLFRFIGQDGKDMITGENFSGSINSDMSFVQSSSGYIGIAIVGQNEQCDSRIWNRYLATYRGGNTDADIVTQWSSLVRHELGHNCSLQHTSGGTMNPSIINGLPADAWPSSDPATSKLKNLFGGVPVPVIGQPVPPTDPNPPSDLQKQIDDLRIKQVVAQVTIDWLVRKVKNLP